VQFPFRQADQPGEALAMFCREILSFKKLPAMLDHPALALNQKGPDAAGCSNMGVSGGNRTPIGKSDTIEQGRVGSGCNLRNRSEIASRCMKEID
jgi:hypothetical protein